MLKTGDEKGQVYFTCRYTQENERSGKCLREQRSEMHRQLRSNPKYLDVAPNLFPRVVRDFTFQRHAYNEYISLVRLQSIPLAIRYNKGPTVVECHPYDSWYSKLSKENISRGYKHVILC